jgi:hypothetical protein
MVGIALHHITKERRQAQRVVKPEPEQHFKDILLIIPHYITPTNPHRVTAFFEDLYEVVVIVFVLMLQVTIEDGVHNNVGRAWQNDNEPVRPVPAPFDDAATLVKTHMLQDMTKYNGVIVAGYLIKPMIQGILIINGLIKALDRYPCVVVTAQVSEASVAATVIEYAPAWFYDVV